MHEFHAHKELCIFGTILMTLGTGLYISLGAASPLATIIIFEVIGGTGAGCLFNPPVIAIQNETAQEHVATATSTQAFTRTMATAIGVVVGGTIFQNGMSKRAEDLRRANLPDTLLKNFSGANAAANVGLVSTIEDAGQAQAIKEAFAWSIRNMWIFYTCVAILGVVAAFFIRSSILSNEHVETRTGLLSSGKDSGGTELSSLSREMVQG
jgi:MFS family permease